MMECEAVEQNEHTISHKSNNSTLSHGVKFRSATQKKDYTAKF
jgi:hypothetical protein